MSTRGKWLGGRTRNLLGRIASADVCTRSARESANHSARALELERGMGKDLIRNMQAALEQRGSQAAEAEERAVAADAELRSAEAESARAGWEAVTRAKVAAIEEERWQDSRKQLERKLQAVKEHQRFYKEREYEEARELAEMRSDASVLEVEAQRLVTELAESEKKTAHTERKALSLARELLETSQSMARLRSEASAYQQLQCDLDEANREEGTLAQRLEQQRAEANVARATVVRDFSLGEGTAGELVAREAVARELVARDRTALKQVSDDTTREEVGLAVSRATPPATPAEVELRQMHDTQDGAVTEALRAAWDAEARERRAVELKMRR